MRHTALRIAHALTALAVALIVGFGAAQDADAVATGQELFLTAGQIGCVACHGPYGLGDLGIGPNIRGLDAVRIQGALEAAEEMEFLLPILTEQDIDALAAYLIHLGTLEPVSATVRAGAWDPVVVDVGGGEQVQLIVTNGNRSSCTLTLAGDAVADQALEPVEIGGRAAGAIALRTPDQTTALEAFCAESPDERLTVQVTNQM